MPVRAPCLELGWAQLPLNIQAAWDRQGHLNKAEMVRKEEKGQMVIRWRVWQMLLVFIYTNGFLLQAPVTPYLGFLLASASSANA